jgi:hypothetical protein
MSYIFGNSGVSSRYFWAGLIDPLRGQHPIGDPYSFLSP